MKLIRKYYLLIFGVLITSASLFLPIIEACDSVDINDNVTFLYILGFESFEYYLGLSISFIILLFSVLKFDKSLIHISTTAIVLWFLTTLIFRFLSIAGWGRPCGSSPTIYYMFMILGFVLIVIYSYKKMGEKRKSIQKGLDDF